LNNNNNNNNKKENFIQNLIINNNDPKNNFSFTTSWLNPLKKLLATNGSFFIFKIFDDQTNINNEIKNIDNNIINKDNNDNNIKLLEIFSNNFNDDENISPINNKNNTNLDNKNIFQETSLELEWLEILKYILNLIKFDQSNTFLGLKNKIKNDNFFIKIKKPFSISTKKSFLVFKPFADVSYYCYYYFDINLLLLLLLFIINCFLNYKNNNFIFLVTNTLY
jgi:hypothetical protein